MRRSFVICISLIAVIFLSVGCTEPQVKVKTKLEEIKVGIVNQERIWTQSSKAQQYQKELNSRVEDIQKKYQQELEDLNEDERVTKHQEMYQEVNNLREDLQKKFKDQIKEVVKKIADEKDLDIVLVKEDVQYGGVDITEEVINRL